MVLQPRVQTAWVAFIDAHVFQPWKAIVMRIQQPFRWRRVAIQRLSRQLTQRIITLHFDECSITIPSVERGANGAHRRNISRKPSPPATGALFGAQRVDGRTLIDVGRAPALW